MKEIVNKPFAQFETVVVNDGVDFSDIDEKFSLQAVPTEPIAAEMPNTIGEQKTAEALIGQPESKNFDESKNTDEQKVADQPTAEVYPSAEAQPMAEEQSMTFLTRRCVSSCENPVCRANSAIYCLLFILISPFFHWKIQSY